MNVSLDHASITQDEHIALLFSRPMDLWEDAAWPIS